MAAGTFVQGASIELSADAPVRPPYVAYMQGGLVFEQVQAAVLFHLNKLAEKIAVCFFVREFYRIL